MDQKEYGKNVLSRREALKSLVAVTGAAALTPLPNDWVSPVIEIAMLPPHAQMSGPAGNTPTPTGPPIQPTATSTPGLPDLACVEVKDKVDVMLALDKSGSISTAGDVAVQELNYAKEALKLFVDGLNLSRDQVGLVSFDTTATLEKELTTDKNAIKAAIDSVILGDLTDIAGAVKLCRNELKSARANPNNEQIIILLSDGAQTVTGDPIDEANKAKSDGITIITVAIRQSADYVTLKAMASKEKDFYFVPAASDLIKIFDPDCDIE
ncbi:MAG: VWA domain-containing protein [Anaerolineae bacterium]|nr:VWA domain-containing protein [Anaerolineae bacterium]